MFLKLKKLLIGKRLKDEELTGQKFNALWGLPVLSSDAISSVAYAGEEILWVLVPVIGILAYKNMFYVALAIIILLFILIFSYRQTIDNYPNGGGSYIVATDNLGTIPGLIAGASLCIDYILTVAVSTSAGTAAITSAVPALLDHKVLISFILIFILTLGNLRGISDSSKMFGVPTYLFIFSAIALIVTGLFKVFVLGYTPQSLNVVPQATGNLTLFIVLRAFSGGCTALTGVEAVSNGIPNFKDPSQRNAKKVLLLLALIVLFIFGGTSFLATLYHAVPNPDVTILAQIAVQVFGPGSFMFYMLQITTAIILFMASNTSYSDFPLLLSLISKNGYAPRQFSKRGDRLSFSNGIILLAAAAGLLIFLFNGETHLLMPLYAIGVFASFTLSQFGMFVKWTGKKSPGWRHKAIINGFGAIVTFFTVLIIGTSKFTAGAWIVLLLIPIFVKIMIGINNHYKKVANQLRLDSEELENEIAQSEEKIEHVIVPIGSFNKASFKAISYAQNISNNIILYNVSLNEEEAADIKKKWEELKLDIPLIVKYSSRYNIVNSLIEFIESEEYAPKNDGLITIIFPQYVVKKWWHNILHNQITLLIKRKLMKNRNVAVVTVPYVL